MYAAPSASLSKETCTSGPWSRNAINRALTELLSELNVVLKDKEKYPGHVEENPRAQVLILDVKTASHSR